MGEAKRKKVLANQANETIREIDQKANLQRVASAIRKLSEASSSNIGRDCYVHARLCQALLARLGVEARLVIGYASWRIGKGDGDTLTHLPQPNVVFQPKAHMYHAWLEVGDPESLSRIILDFTTYQFHRKAAALDEMDGGHTTVEWSPEYLAVPFSQVRTAFDVGQLHPGLFHYQRDPALEELMVSQSQPADPEDLATLTFVYQNPDIHVFGPNHASGISPL